VSRIRFYPFVLLYVVGLFYLVVRLPIGPHEALVLYQGEGVVVDWLTHLFEGVWGNQLDFRLPFLLFGMLNIPLFLMMARGYFDSEEDSYLATAIYLLLPGIITASVIVNIAVVVITLVLVFILCYKRDNIIGEYLVMIALLFVHDASVIFFIAVAIFSAFKRNQKLFYMAILLSGISLLYFNGLDIGGKPQGKFLELFGLYVALFSPFVFIYFFYALYRIWLKEEKDILWYISFTAFVLSIFLSLRQQVIMTDFAPYVVVSVVLMVLIYHKTVYVRLPQFQRNYWLGYRIVIGSLLVSASMIFFHESLFYIIRDKTKHFAYPFYKPYWISLELKEIGQNCYTAERQRMQYQLYYYGITPCQKRDVPKIHN